MATDALQIINSQGVIQLDGSDRTMRLVASGTGGATPAGFPPFTTISFAAQTYVPLVFIRPTSDGTFVGTGGVTNNSFSYNSTGPVEWIVYGLDNPAAMDATPYGAQVFDSLGRVVWDSRQEVPRIASILTVDMPWPDYIQGAPASFPAYPYTRTFTPWGTRPWILLNALFLFTGGDVDGGEQIVATTQGLDSIVIRCGIWPGTGAWGWLENNGTGWGYTRSIPGGRLVLPIGRRDI